MNEMDLLRDHHDAQPPPTPEAVAAARARLIAHTRPRRRRVLRISRPVLTGLALTAAAAAAAAAILIPDGTPAPRPEPPPSGRQILLSAAQQAALTETTGKYWHVKEYTEVSGEAGRTARIVETWATREGQRWVGYRELRGSRAGQARLAKVKGSNRFLLCDKEMTFAQVQGLPTDAAGLKAAMVRAMNTNDDGPVPPSAQQNFVASCLTNLLATVPAPPKVRAAAYRALADMPNVMVDGPASDPRGRPGVAVTVTARTQHGRDAARLFIDPRTSLVLARQVTAPSADPEGGAESRHTTAYLEVGWTDQKPRVPTE